MKIAIFHNLLSGGAKRALNEICRRMGARHTLHVYTLSSSNHEFADIRPLVAQYTIFPFEPGKLFQSPFGRLNPLIRLNDLSRIERVYAQIAAAIDAEGYDIVFVQPCQVEYSPSVLHYLRKTPSVFFCQESLRVFYEPNPERPYDPKESGRQALLNRVDPLPGIYRRALMARDQRNLHSATQVIVNSVFTQQSTQKIYQVTGKVYYLGVNTDLFTPLNLPRQSYVLSVGSLTPLKGFDFLIRALGKIAQELRPPLHIVSNFQNQPERDYLTALASQHAVSLTLHKDITDQQLVELYNRAALTLYAAIREPFGFVPIESMACATPIVAVKEGGVQETMIDGGPGRLTPRDESAFAQAVTDLLTHPTERQAMGQRGLALARERWSWDVSTANLERILQDTLLSVEADR